MSMSWKQHGDGKTVAPEAIVLPEERLSWPKTIGFGAQHVVAMFGATFLVPLLTGFPPTATLFFSGLGTLLFLLLTGNRLPLASKYNVSVKLAQWFEMGRGRFDWQALLSYRSSYFLSQFNEKDIVFLDGERQNALQAGFPDRQVGFTTLNLGVVNGDEWKDAS